MRSRTRRRQKLRNSRRNTLRRSCASSNNARRTTVRTGAAKAHMPKGSRRRRTPRTLPSRVHRGQRRIRAPVSMLTSAESRMWMISVRMPWTSTTMTASRTMRGTRRSARTRSQGFRASPTHACGFGRASSPCAEIQQPRRCQVAHRSLSHDYGEGECVGACSEDRLSGLYCHQELMRNYLACASSLLSYPIIYSAVPSDVMHTLDVFISSLIVHSSKSHAFESNREKTLHVIHTHNNDR